MSQIEPLVDQPSANRSVAFQIGGALGQALDKSYERRIKAFIVDAESPALAMFAIDNAEKNVSGDWYGEHVGKWLLAACSAARRTSDDELTSRIGLVADRLVEVQRTDGYLGTYQAGSPPRLDFPSSIASRTWDVWVHTYVILGLVAAWKLLGQRRHLEAAKAAARFVLNSDHFKNGRLMALGNHNGLSSFIFLDALAELFGCDGEIEFYQHAQEVIRQMEEPNSLQMISKLCAGQDVSEIGTGKIYQMCWLLSAIAKIQRANRESLFVRALEQAWKSIVESHLTPQSGPWGGIATHKEVFNLPGFFDPAGLVETCSAMAWIAFNSEMFALLGRAEFLEQIECSVYNSIMGAQDANGEDWCYFTFPNGRRNNTYYWACCKSSGAIALEQAAEVALRVHSGCVDINLWVSAMRGDVSVIVSEYFDEATVRFHRSLQGRLRARIPSWASNFSADSTYVIEDGYAMFEGSWLPENEIKFSFDPKIEILKRSAIIQHHGQEISRTDYFAISRGPLVYASTLIDGYRRTDTFRLPVMHPEKYFQFANGMIELRLPGYSPLKYLPYWKAGGRHDGAWRTTWHEVAWQ